MATMRSTSKISSKWVRRTQKYFLKFLHATHFPPVERHGQRGKTFEYPEWLIMLIGVLAVKCKEPTYLGIHRMTCRFWHELCGRQLRVPPISESQLRARLKKNRLPAWNGSRICISNLSSRVPRVRSSAAIR
jgi:hypothetical protein